MDRPIDGIDIDGLEFIHYTAKQIGVSLASLDNRFIDQGEAGTCGSTALAYIWLKNDPKGFKKALVDLWVNGKTTYNNMTLTPNSTLQNTDSKNAAYPFQGDNRDAYSVDFIMVSSIQDKQNWIKDYHGLITEENRDGSSDFQIKYMMKNLLGLIDVSNEQPTWEEKYNNTEAILNKMESRKASGFDQILSIDARMLGNPEMGFHAVVYDGGFKKEVKGETTYYNFNVISWGKRMNVSLTNNQFSLYFYNVISGKKKEK